MDTYKFCTIIIVVNYFKNYAKLNLLVLVGLILIYSFWLNFKVFYSLLGNNFTPEHSFMKIVRQKKVVLKTNLLTRKLLI